MTYRVFPYTISISQSYMIGRACYLHLNGIIDVEIFRLSSIVMNPIVIPTTLPTLTVIAGVYLISEIILGEIVYKKNDGSFEDAFNYSPLANKRKELGFSVRKGNLITVKGEYDGFVPQGYLSGTPSVFCVTLDGQVLE